MIISPLSDELKKLAAGYVLDDLETTQIAQVELLINQNPALLKEIQQLQSVTGIMTSNVPQIQPPADLLAKIMNSLD